MCTESAVLIKGLKGGLDMMTNITICTQWTVLRTIVIRIARVKILGGGAGIRVGEGGVIHMGYELE